jgi:hypothetical protein
MKSSRYLHTRVAHMCVGLLLLVTTCTQVHAWTSLMKHDPVYVYSTEPHAYLLMDPAKARLLGYQCDPDYVPGWMTFAITPYYQKAKRGRDYDRQRAQLGDLEGRWDILGMIYGNKPATGRPATGEQIIRAREAIYGSPLPPNSINVDPAHLFGYYSVPIDYRKAGVRTEWSFNPICWNWGVTIQCGVTDLKQTNSVLVDLSVEKFAGTVDQISERTDLTHDQIEDARNFVTTETDARTILQQQGYDLCDFQKTTVEDVHIRLWWRRPFLVNSLRDPQEWPIFIFTPYIVGQVSIDVAHKLDRMFGTPHADKGAEIFGLSAGNDKHLAVGFIGGFFIDFIETVEIGIEGGMLHFFSRDIKDFRLPNFDSDDVQFSVFPYATDVNLQPGRNYFFRANLHADYFIDHLSACVEYTFVDHSEDEIELLRPDPDFFPDIIECRSKWMAQMLLTALNYDISPNITLGFGIQWPLMQRNSYRTTTVLGTLRCTF